MSLFSPTSGGIVVIGRLGGGIPSSRDYVIPAADGTVVARGDLVKLDLGVGDALSGLQTVIKAAAGDVPVGVVMDIKPNNTGSTLLDPALVRQASVRTVVRVCDDPLAVMAVKAKGTGASSAHDFVITDLGKFANIETSTGSSTTGGSNTFLDATTLTTTGTLHTIRLLNGDPSNVTNGVVVCSFGVHALASMEGG